MPSEPGSITPGTGGNAEAQGDGETRPVPVACKGQSRHLKLGFPESQNHPLKEGFSPASRPAYLLFNLPCPETDNSRSDNRAHVSIGP